MERTSSENFIKKIRRAVSALDRTFNLAVLVILLLLLAFGCYALWDSRQVHTAASSTAYEVFKPTAENPGSLEELVRINPEAVGWLTIYGTGIDYPLMQAEDNRKYINTSATGEYSLAGAIFLDYCSAPDFSDYRTLIHGHNMAENAMFGQISDFAQQDFFDSHRYGNVFYDHKDHGLIIFEYLQADAYDDDIYHSWPETEEEKTEYYDRLTARAKILSADSFRDAGHIVVMSTCATGFTNARDLLVGVITEETFEDPFAKKDPAPVRMLRHTTHFPVPILAVYVTVMLIILRRFLLYVFDRQSAYRASVRRKENNEGNPGI